jgi:hypothetical protein
MQRRSATVAARGHGVFRAAGIRYRGFRLCAAPPWPLAATGFSRSRNPLPRISAMRSDRGRRPLRRARERVELDHELGHSLCAHGANEPAGALEGCACRLVYAPDRGLPQPGFRSRKRRRRDRAVLREDPKNGCAITTVKASDADHDSARAGCVRGVLHRFQARRTPIAAQWWLPEIEGADNRTSVAE